MGRAQGTKLLLAVVCAGYAVLLAISPAAAHGWLATGTLALAIGGGFWVGARAGGLVGALLGALQLAIAAGATTPLATYVTFVVTQAMCVVAGYGAGVLRQRLDDALTEARDGEARYALAVSGSQDGLWDWDVRTGQVVRSARWHEIAGEQAAHFDPGTALLAPVHPDDVASAREQLEAHLRGETPRYEHAHRIRHTDGSWRWVMERGLAQRDASGAPIRMAGFLTDISEHKETEARLRHHAFHDALTGLPNRALFMDRVQHTVARTRRSPTSSFAVLMLDLDRFKSVNDSLGHAAGDQLLMRVAERIGACVRDGDTLARLGGDEFSVLLETLDDDQHASRVAEQIQRALATPIPLGGSDVVTSASIGVVIARDDAFDALSLLRRADQAMYAAKKQGRGRHAVFEASVHASSSLRQALDEALRTAIREKQLRVYYQPIIQLSTGEVCGFEALVRWPHPKLGLVSPAELVPVAEASDAIVELSDFVLGEACRAVHRLETIFRPTSAFRMAVNVSARELVRDDLVERVEGALERADVRPHSLVLEVKETALMDDWEAGQEAFQKLRERGVRIHMDDFGTGMSSLSYLHRFQLDALKIDGAFTGRLHDNAGAEEIVRSVITIARDLRLSVVAEGVENREQLRRLRTLGCDEAQGFLFGAPLPLEAVEALLRRGPKLAVA